MGENHRVRLISERRLDIGGFLYCRSFVRDGSTYWDCMKLRSKECSARAVTELNPAGDVIVKKGPRQSPHEHGPSRDAAEAERIKADIKRIADEDQDEMPAAIIRGFASIFS